MDALIWDKGFKARKFDKDVAAEAGANQKCWESAAGCPVVLGFAKELGLDVGKFKADMKGCQQLDRRRTCASSRSSASARRRRSSSTAGSCRARCRSTTSSTLVDEELKKANETIQQGTPAAQYYQQWVIDKGLKTLEAPKQ